MSEKSVIPDTRREKLKSSVAGLIDTGRVDPILGTIINAGIVAIGLVIFVFTTGALSYVGAFFAILSALGIFKWVLAQ
jgi:hypothetical protein